MKSAKRTAPEALTARTVPSDAIARMELNAVLKLANASAKLDGLDSSASVHVRSTNMARVVSKPAIASTTEAAIRPPEFVSAVLGGLASLARINARIGSLDRIARLSAHVINPNRTTATRRPALVPANRNIVMAKQSNTLAFVVKAPAR